MAQGQVVARDARFGGENGGFTIVVNKASFLHTYDDHCSNCSHHTGRLTPPGRGPLPPGTAWQGDPQGASIILDRCSIDSYGNDERQTNIWLEQLPAILVVESSAGFAYTPESVYANFSFLKVDPSLDLDGPQLDLAAKHPHMLRYDIGASNNYGPKGHYWQLPQQLWPYLQGRPVYAYEEGTDVPASHPPSKGVWQSNQVVLAPLNSTNSSSQPRGWRCVRGGKPGVWAPLA